MGKKKNLTHLSGSDIFKALKTWLFNVSNWQVLVQQHGSLRVMCNFAHSLYLLMQERNLDCYLLGAQTKKITIINTKIKKLS